MKILLDEDTPEQLLDVLRHLLPAHHVDHVGKIRWKAKADVRLLSDARRRGYNAIITVDSNQLEKPDELDAIKKSGLHHIRFTQRRDGLRGLGLALGAVFSAMPLIAAELDATQTQHLVSIKGINPTPTSRFELVDPLKDPPRYWPR